MTHRAAIYLIVALLIGPLVNHTFARSRSFALEITGTIATVDQLNHIFTIQIDKSGRILTMAIGRDCKFQANGTPAGEWILKQGVRVKVSYFATIFTGNVVVEIGLLDGTIPNRRS